MVTVVYILCILQYLTTSLGVLTKTNSKSLKFLDAQISPKKDNDFEKERPHCPDRPRTDASPFVVFFLLKTSGHFLGMGIIVDRKTVLTVLQVISPEQRKPQKVLVLAGCRSPWWAKYSQVRSVSALSVHEYGLVLIEIEEPWRICKNVRPIPLPTTLVEDLKAKYQNEIGLFGITISDYFLFGESVPKAVNYALGVHSPAEAKVCGQEYKDIKPDFSDKVHTCLQGNVSFCAGCLGSPVVALTKDSELELVGIVIRSSCRFYPRNVVMMKLYPFKEWIQSSSLLGKN